MTASESRRPEPTVPPYVQVIAANVRSARARADVGQDVVADRMTTLGHKWYRATVSAIERGERRVSADELLPLSLALEISVARLLSANGYQAVALPNGQPIQGGLVSASAGLLGLHDAELVEWHDGQPWFSAIRAPGTRAPDEEVRP